MGIRSTHTYAVLEVSQSAFDEIAARLHQADYGHAFSSDGLTIDMHGIGITPAEDDPERPPEIPQRTWNSMNPGMRARIKAHQPSQTQTPLEATTLALGKLVGCVDQSSALNGLTLVATAFSALLQTYALPNAENPKGMCDSPDLFRRHFAEIIATAAAEKREDMGDGKL